MPTLFEKILAGEVPADIIHKDDLSFAIRDNNPQAPVHILVIPRQPLPRLGEASPSDKELLGHLLLVARQLAASENLAEGFRIVINNGPDGGESIPHLHVHLLGGRQLSWPPG
ncbi:MAG: histidine triad nucleotide-binding protein [Oceanipulchritudo sp.]